MFAATHPSRTTALVVLEGYAQVRWSRTGHVFDGIHRRHGPPSGARVRVNMLVNPDMPWNEEIRAAWARHGTSGGQPKDAVRW